MGFEIRRAGGAVVLVTLASVVLSGCGAGTAPADARRAETRLPAQPSAAPSPGPAATDVTAELAALEEAFSARVGVSAIDTGTGRSVAYRADERFPYASTIKVFAAAELLRRVPAAERDVVVTWTQDDVDAAGYAPVAAQHVGDGLTLARLAEAAVRESDNAALNLVLDRLGGPAALDAGLEAIGDSSSEVVHEEPALNVVRPGSTEDTSTPLAFTATLRTLLQGEVLASADRAILLDWMSGNATGDALIRAGAPAGWTVADKSGGAGGVRNDIAVVTPPGRDPILLTVFTAKSDAAAGYEDRLVAEAAAVVLAALK